VSATSPADKVDFPTFFYIWAVEVKQWDVPDVHWRAVHWLQHRGVLAVLRCFRGFGKSTLLALYNAWRYYDDPAYRILHQGDQDKTAYKTSRDTKAVLMRHPLTREDYAATRGEAAFWWVPGAQDERNPSMQAAGITSNITSSRCDEAQNDDVEVPRNIQNLEAREKMRYRLGEQTHCMVPGARQLFVGTPHTHDSLYDEMERMGADCLTIKMFEREFRVEDARHNTYDVGFKPEVVFTGIGAGTRALKNGVDYRVEGTCIVLKTALGGLLDCYAGSAWPERFDLAEMEARRKKCKTINEWDSQYQLHSRPIHEVRLDPDKIKAYDVEPTFRRANGEAVMLLGRVRIVGASCKWDPSSGKLRSDVSSLSVMLFDDMGNRYWHRALALRGEVAEFDKDGKTIIGGQVFEIVATVRDLQLSRVVIETNGAGTFAPDLLKAAFKQAKLKWSVGVTGKHETLNKNKRILEAFEGPLTSGKLWAHTSVTDGPVYAQMRDFNPGTTEQEDDHLDSGAGALTEAPERIGKVGGSGWIQPAAGHEDWRPDTGIHEVELEG
jgi:hypothetical protein